MFENGVKTRDTGRETRGKRKVKRKIKMIADSQ